MMRYPEIRLTGCQIKSIEKARVIAAALDTLEIEAGIKVTRVTLVDCFICPDLYEEIDTLNRTPMERSLRRILCKLDEQERKNGKK